MLPRKFLLLFYIFTCLATAEVKEIFEFVGNTLAPFSAFLGDGTVGQYLSESLFHIDSVTFAIFTIGLLTIMTSVIRVCGSARWRGILGKAREARANADKELCSSVSEDVCEAFGKDGVCRSLGRPKILELVIEKEHDYKDDTAGIYTFVERVRLKQNDPNAPMSPDEPNREWECYHRTDKRPAASDNNLEGQTLSKASSPNLSLNVGFKRVPMFWYWLFVVVAIPMQLGIIAMAFLFQRIPVPEVDDKKRSEKWLGPLLFTIGTLFFTGGAFLCAFLINRSTHEQIWRCNIPGSLYIWWVQPGGQVIGDQTYDSFSYINRNFVKYIISRKRQETCKDLARSSNLALLSFFGAGLGYLLQVIGQRWLNFLVPLAQLVATIIASIFRLFLRGGRLSSNDNSFAHVSHPDLIKWHELDCTALQIVQDRESRSADGSGSAPWLLFFSRAADVQDRITKISSPEPRLNIAMKALAVRRRLAELTSSSEEPSHNFTPELVAVRPQAKLLSRAIESTLDAIFTNAQVKEEWRDAEIIRWKFNCMIHKSKDVPDREEHAVYFDLHRSPETDGLWKFRKPFEVEAFLGLWVWSLKLSQSMRPGSSQISSKRIVASDSATKAQIELWYDRLFDVSTEHTVTNFEAADGNLNTLWGKTNDGMQPYETISARHLDTHTQEEPTSSKLRYSGWYATGVPEAQDSQSTTVWAMECTDSMILLCAQEMLGLFVSDMLEMVDSFGSIDIDDQSVLYQQQYPLVNEFLSKLVRTFTENDMASEVEAYAIIMPSFVSMMKTLQVPIIREVASHVPVAVERADRQAKRGDYKGAEATLWRAQARICKSSALISDETMGKDLRLIFVDAPLARIYAHLYLLYVRKFLRLSDVQMREFGKRGLGLLDGPNVEWPKLVQECRKRKHADVQMLLERTPFLWAIEENSIPAIKELLVSGAQDLEEAVESSGARPLHLLARNGHDELVKHLVDNIHVALDCRDENLRTPLLEAAENGHGLVVKTLLDTKKVNASHADVEGRTAFWHAAKSGQVSVMKTLFEYNLPESANKNFPKTADKYLQMPLHAAAECGHEDAVRYLLDVCEASLNLIDQASRTPLFLASMNGHARVVQLLLAAKGVNPTIANLMRETPLSVARKNGYGDIAEWLERAIAEHGS